MTQKYFILFFLIFCNLKRECDSHGRMLNPLNRASLWRDQRFDQYNPDLNYNDNELFCGGLQNHHEENNGLCGECGDSYNLPRPRPHESGGKHGKGYISEYYIEGQEIESLIELTANHFGYFCWSLCLSPYLVPNEETCYKNLELADGSGEKYFINTTKTGMYNIRLKLPQNVIGRGILRWTYVSGNNWGWCDEDHTYGQLGCGPQETFKNCADIYIYPKEKQHENIIS